MGTTLIQMTDEQFASLVVQFLPLNVIEVVLGLFIYDLLRSFFGFLVTKFDKDV